MNNFCVKEFLLINNNPHKINEKISSNKQSVQLLIKWCYRHCKVVYQFLFEEFTIYYLSCVTDDYWTGEWYGYEGTHFELISGVIWQGANRSKKSAPLGLSAVVSKLSTRQQGKPRLGDLAKAKGWSQEQLRRVNEVPASDPPKPHVKIPSDLLSDPFKVSRHASDFYPSHNRRFGELKGQCWRGIP